MGSGGSKRLQIVQPRVNVTPFSNHSENPMQIAFQPKVLQEQWLSHDREDENNEESSSQEDDEWDVLHTDTLTRYTINHPEQEEVFQAMFENMRGLRNTMNNSDRYSDQVIMVFLLVENICHTIDNSTETEATKRMRVLDFVVEIEAAELLQRFAQNYFKDFYKMGGEQGNDNSSSKVESWEKCFSSLQRVLLTIITFTYLHDGFCSASAQAGVVPMCLENIVRLDRENGNWQSGDDKSKPVHLISCCLAILQNISRRLRDRELFVDSEETLLYFAKVKKTKIAASALLCLAYLVNEETNHLISADENLLCFIITLLNEAYQSEDRSCNGFTTKGLAEGLSHLAINDNNNKILGQNGAIRVLLALLQTSHDDEETASGASALWMLAFDDTNKGLIKQQEGMLDTLRKLHHSANPKVQKAVAGALWEIEGKKARNKAEKLAEKIEETTTNHVMISYQWDAQKVLVEVKNKLQASGYRVWMDLEQMGGSTLDAMAKAVENAAVVLVCVSQRYKESPNCRSEGEYAYRRQKDIIPLMMQRNYTPDGWLGILVGTKLWIDFQNKQAINSGVAKLIKELGGRGKDIDTTDGPKEAVIRPIEASVVTAPPPQSVTNVSSWTNQDVKKWLTEIGLEQVCKEETSEFNGQTLIDLQELHGDCPDYFYKCLEHTLNLKNMFEVFKFRKELDKLLSH